MDHNYIIETDFLKRINDPDIANRTYATEEKIAKIQQAYPGIPEDYLNYLRYVGYGSIRNNRYAIYSGPTTLSNLNLEEHYPQEENIILFGDNFSGDFGCFIVNRNYAVAELWHDSNELYEEGLSFRDFMREVISMKPNGEEEVD